MKQTRSGRRDTRKTTRHFGLHLTLDGYLANPKSLSNLELITRTLAQLPERLRLKRLIPPYVVPAPANGKKDPGGYSGFVIIQESHVSVHTFPARRFISIDVYSCKDFKVPPVVAFFRRVFDIRNIEQNLVIRGKEYPVQDLR